MTQIDEMQSRILNAMERISTGVGKLEQACASAQEEARAASDNTELETALEEERTANAQLEERVKLLHERLKEAEANAGSGASGEDVAAMQAELELLRNEVGNDVEKEALKLEVQRLKSELESSGNEAAANKEALETKVAELTEEKQTLVTELAEASSGSEDIGSAVDQAALEAENATLKSQLEAAQSAASSASPAANDEALLRLDAELQKLRLANEQLRSSNAALRDANAQGLPSADLINSALTAEVEGLRAAKASDDAQVNAVLAKLEPLLANAQNLPEGEEA